MVTCVLIMQLPQLGKMFLIAGWFHLDMMNDDMMTRVLVAQVAQRREARPSSSIHVPRLKGFRHDDANNGPHRKQHIIY